MNSQSFKVESTTNSHCFRHHHHPKLCLISDERVDFLERKQAIQSKYFKMNQLNTKISIKSNKRFSSPALMSLVLIIHIISNQSIISILEAGRGFASISSASNLDGDNEITNSRRSSNSGFINFASAEPAPVPASVTIPQASTSRSHRGPPMNGSMFGKRGVDKIRSIQKSQYQQANSANLDYIAAKNKQNFRTQASSYNDIITEIIENFLASNNESKY